MYRDFEDTAAELANGYVASGDAGYAELSARPSGALGAGRRAARLHGDRAAGRLQPGLVSGRVVGVRRGAGPVPGGAPSRRSTRPGSRASIAWLHKVSRKQISYPGGDNTCCNNHAYWRGLHATMIGVLANDRRSVPLGTRPLHAGHRPHRRGRQLAARDGAPRAGAALPELCAAAGGDDRRDRGAAGPGPVRLQVQRPGPGRRDRLSRPARWRRCARTARQPDSPSSTCAPSRPDGATRPGPSSTVPASARDPLGLLGKPIINARTGGKVTFLLGQPASAKAGS